LGNIDEAYDAFFKATWDNAHQDAAYNYIAQIDLLRGHHEECLDHINWAMDRNARNGKAYVLKSVALTQLGLLKKATETIELALQRDFLTLAPVSSSI